MKFLLFLGVFLILLISKMIVVFNLFTAQLRRLTINDTVVDLIVFRGNELFPDNRTKRGVEFRYSTRNFSNVGAKSGQHRVLI